MRLIAALAGLVLLPAATTGQEILRNDAGRVTVESNVIYGMYSGLALLMDVYRPDRPNGRGILVIPGSGFHAPLAYGAAPLKGTRPGEMGRVASLYSGLADAGYTLFLINHRAAPRFRYPGALDDARRAARFVRYHASRYGIDPDRLGALGHSSGGYLVSLLGMLDGAGDPTDPDPVNRESARVQAVVAGAAPTDLTLLHDAVVGGIAAAFLGQALNPDSRDLYRDASPVHHATDGSAPFLLVHADGDSVVIFRHAEVMLTALRDVGVDADLIHIEGGGHGALFRTDLIRPIVAWFNRQLLDSAAVLELEPLLVAFERVVAGLALAEDGNVHAALEEYERALGESDRLTISGSSWNRVCWLGSLHGQADATLAACERALGLAPRNPGFRDSRGLARALTGDIAGAVSDFESFVSSTDSSSPAVAQRQSWIAELRAGRNPFTPEVLERLRK